VRYCIAVLLCCAVFAQQPQPPSPAPVESTEKNKDKASPEQKTTADQKSADDFSALADKVEAEMARRKQLEAANKATDGTPVNCGLLGIPY